MKNQLKGHHLQRILSNKYIYFVKREKQAIVLSVLLRFTASEYPSGIFKLFLSKNYRY
jgi:hypothetical protein